MFFKNAVIVSVIVIGTQSCGVRTPAYSYTTEVRLRDGTLAKCAVNEKLDEGRAATVLSVRAENEAEVLATQRLRLASGPWSPYPDPFTAPVVKCVGVAS